MFDEGLDFDEDILPDEDIYTDNDIDDSAEEDISEEPENYADHSFLDGSEIGVLLAMAEGITKDNKNITIDSKTDQENWINAMQLLPSERINLKDDDRFWEDIENQIEQTLPKSEFKDSPFDKLC